MLFEELTDVDVWLVEPIKELRVVALKDTEVFKVEKDLPLVTVTRLVHLFLHLLLTSCILRADHVEILKLFDRGSSFEKFNFARCESFASFKHIVVENRLFVLEIDFDKFSRLRPLVVFDYLSGSLANAVILRSDSLDHI